MTQRFGLSRGTLAIAVVVLATTSAGCSVKKLAVNMLGNALSSGGSNYTRDDDPEFVGQAIPFGLKTIESLLDSSPRHKGLLFAAASGFMEYGFAYVLQEADFIESKDFVRATELRARARRLYRRGMEYGLRGLEVDFPGFRDKLRQDPKAALAPMRKEHVGLLFWTGLNWGALISISKEDSELTADQNLVEAIQRRALALDETYENGAIHEFFILYESGRASAGGSYARAREHFERATSISKGRRAAAYVAMAESVSVSTQNRKEFEELLGKVLAMDPDQFVNLRLGNLLYQKRARWLLSRADELFIE